jgi:riboflavin synthase
MIKVFTGLVSEIGVVQRRVRVGEFQRLTVAAPKTAAGLKPGDSVATAGACLTVESVASGIFTCSIIAETLATTRLGYLKSGDRVNLELAVGPQDVFGGHLVAGHIDTVGKVVQVQKVGGGGRVRIGFARVFDKWVVEKGSVAVDGISLTVAERRGGEILVGIIPTTWAETTIGVVKPGDRVNLEFDQVIKAAVQAGHPKQANSNLTEENLRRAGW